MNQRIEPVEHLPLTVPVYQILLSVADESLHGYAIIKDVGERTEGEVRLTASTLYAAIKRLVSAGMLEETDERPSDDDDARRRYYRITEYGTEVLTEEARRLHRAADMARRKNVLPALAARKSR